MYVSGHLQLVEDRVEIIPTRLLEAVFLVFARAEQENRLKYLFTRQAYVCVDAVFAHLL